MGALIVENHHYNAWCRECPWHGPLRFRRDLAAVDALQHDVLKHDAPGPDDEWVAPDPDAVDPLWPHTARPASAPDAGFDRAAIFGPRADHGGGS